MSDQKEPVRLLTELKNEVQTLITEKRRLRSENEDLKNELDKLHKEKALMGDLNSRERIVLKQQIGQMITKIDHHLENS